MAHKYYQPTDYEEMMLAAGWVTMADLDDDYLEYLRTAPDLDGYATYKEWVQMKRNWDEANERYEREIQPYYTGDRCNLPLPSELEKLQNQLLREMGNIEYALGY